VSIRRSFRLRSRGLDENTNRAVAPPEAGERFDGAQAPRAILGCADRVPWSLAVRLDTYSK
jgi:hypothetical protein